MWDRHFVDIPTSFLPRETTKSAWSARACELTFRTIERYARTPRTNSTDLSKAAEKCPLRSRSYLLQQFRIARRTQRACERSDAKQRQSTTVPPMGDSETSDLVKVELHWPFF